MRNKKSILTAICALLFWGVNSQTTLTLNGTDNKVSVPKNGNGVMNDFTNPHDFTIEARVMFNSLPSNSSIISKHAPSANGFFIEVKGGNIHSGMGHTFDYDTITGAALSIGQFYHIALSYSDSSNSFKLYLNGILVGTKTLTSSHAPDIDNHISIGSSDHWGGFTDLTLDYFRIWDIQKTDTDISTNKDIEVSGSSSNLLLQYTFATGITITDNTGNGNTGIFHGTTPQIAGDINGNGVIDGSEVAGDIDGNGVIDGSEVVGDINGNGVIDGSEVANDANGNGIANDCEDLTLLGTPTVYNVTANIDTLEVESSNTGLTYQWINCSDNSPIAGETNQSFIATTNGDYAVIVTNGSCSDTSACTTINSASIEKKTISFSIHPNPTSGEVNIETNEPVQLIEIFSTSGQKVASFTEKTFSIETMKKGVYFVKVLSNNGVAVKRIVRK